MNLARHESVDTGMGEGSEAILPVRFVPGGRHKYVSGSRIDPRDNFSFWIVMLRLFWAEGETDSESDYTS